MGNRAVITTKKGGKNKLGIYVHWNGGRDSVSAFLRYAKMRGFRLPEEDNYGWARLCQVIANFIGGDLSVGIDVAEYLDQDNWDNGVYLIENWEIVGREYFNGEEQDSHDLTEMLIAIDDKQPEADRLGRDKILELLKKKEQHE